MGCRDFAAKQAKRGAKIIEQRGCHLQPVLPAPLLTICTIGLTEQPGPLWECHPKVNMVFLKILFLAFR